MYVEFFSLAMNFVKTKLKYMYVESFSLAMKQWLLIIDKPKSVEHLKKELITGAGSHEY